MSVATPETKSNGPAAAPAGAGNSAAEAQAPVVEAGQRAVVALSSTIRHPEVISVPPAELTERLAWRLPRFDFSETSIAEAIAMFNRHNQVRLRAGDDAVGALRITGVFRSDNLEGFVRALAATSGVTADRKDDEIVLRKGI